MSTYAIRGGREGAQRLDLLARTMAPTTEALLAAIGVEPGCRCLDLGCGPGHVSRTLASLVGPAGQVVGLDFDPVKLEAAREESDRAGVANTEFRRVDLTHWDEPGRYDLVFARFLVSHLADRPALVAAARRALRAGGRLVLEDIDMSGSFCWPPNEGFAAYRRMYHAVVDRRGGDANAGAQLYALCLGAGLADVRVQVVQPAHTGEVPEKELTLSTLINIADSVLAEGLASRAEVDAAIASLTALTRDPTSIIGVPRIFQVWGRAPAPA